MKLAGGKARPYLVPADECVEVEPWMLGNEPLPPLLSDWDPNTNLDLVRTVVVDCEMLQKQCALGSDTLIEAGVVWSSNRTRFRETGSRIKFPLEENLVRLNLQATVPGDRAGGRLALETVLSVSAPSTNPESTLAASRVGDVLWAERSSVALEGSLARFPVSVVDFDELTGIETGAFWVLSGTNGSFDEPFTASLRLFVNSRHPDVVASVEGSLDSESSLAMRRQLHFDVARNLINLALDSEEFTERNGDFEEGTLGFGLFELLSACFGPSLDFEALRASRVKHSSAFEATLQSRFMGAVSQ